MNFGYARVSRRDQHIEQQELMLREAGCQRIFLDQGESGADGNRPELQRLLDQLRLDDVVVVTKLDRLSRSLVDMLSIVRTIESRGAGLRSLAESVVDTTTPAGCLTFQIFAVVAEFERERMRERTREGLARAKAKGIQLGRKRKLSLDQSLSLRKLRQSGSSYGELARTFGISRSTARQYVMEDDATCPRI